MRNIDRFRGCLIGGAAGDALGYAVEFMLTSKPRTQRGSAAAHSGQYSALGPYKCRGISPPRSDCRWHPFSRSY